MSPITASDPKSLIAYLRGLKWPPMEPPDKDEFLSDIMESLDGEDDLIRGTLLYLVRKHMPPERQIEWIRDLYRTRFSSYKEKLISHHTDSLKNKAHISEIIAFIDDLSEIAANTDIWINNNLQKLAKPRTKWWQFWRP
jgi:hypothetical protein